MNTQDAIITRRSVRAYTSQHITKEQVTSVLNAAYASPVAGNLYKTMHITVVQNKDMVSKISETFKKESGAESDPLYGAPMLIIVSGKDDFDHKALFANTGCILENIQLSAWEMGLGSVIKWAVGTILPTKKELVNKLGIPEGFQPLAGVLIGHPAKDVSKRIPQATFKTNYI